MANISGQPFYSIMIMAIGISKLSNILNIPVVYCNETI